MRLKNVEASIFGSVLGFSHIFGLSEADIKKMMSCTNNELYRWKRGDNNSFDPTREQVSTMIQILSVRRNLNLLHEGEDEVVAWMYRHNVTLDNCPVDMLVAGGEWLDYLAAFLDRSVRTVA